MVNKVYKDAAAALDGLLFDGMTLMSGGVCQVRPATGLSFIFSDVYASCFAPFREGFVPQPLQSFTAREMPLGAEGVVDSGVACQKLLS
jgi:hypothetical protein